MIWAGLSIYFLQPENKEIYVVQLCSSCVRARVWYVIVNEDDEDDDVDDDVDDEDECVIVDDT